MIEELKRMIFECAATPTQKVEMLRVLLSVPGAKQTPATPAFPQQSWVDQYGPGDVINRRAVSERFGISPQAAYQRIDYALRTGRLQRIAPGVFCKVSAPATSAPGSTGGANV